MHRLWCVRAGMPGRSDQAGHRAWAREMAVAQRRVFQDLAEYHHQEDPPGRLQGMGGGGRQGAVFLPQSWDRRLIFLAFLVGSSVHYWRGPWLLTTCPKINEFECLIY